MDKKLKHYFSAETEKRIAEIILEAQEQKPEFKTKGIQISFDYDLVEQIINDELIGDSLVTVRAFLDDSEAYSKERNKIIYMGAVHQTLSFLAKHGWLGIKINLDENWGDLID